MDEEYYILLFNDHVVCWNMSPRRHCNKAENNHTTKICSHCLLSLINKYDEMLKTYKSPRAV